MPLSYHAASSLWGILSENPQTRSWGAYTPRHHVCGFMGSPYSRFRALCAHYPRIVEFIPPQRRQIQEYRNNSNAFANIILKRHECRAPFDTDADLDRIPLR